MQVDLQADARGTLRTRRIRSPPTLRLLRMLSEIVGDGVDLKVVLPNATFGGERRTSVPTRRPDTLDHRDPAVVAVCCPDRLSTQMERGFLMPGIVESIFIAPVASAPMTEVESVRAVAGRGLEGDRYFEGTGTASHKKNKPREVTLIEAEALEAATRDESIEVSACESRRNILVRGVALNHLVGREFGVGGARFLGHELCEPCGHLERLTRPGVRASLVHRGGLRCAIVADGMIAKGDRVVAE